jgi:choice-of-anchor C domain-containing protein
MKRVLALGIGLVLLLACVGTGSANLVANGGFELPQYDSTVGYKDMSSGLTDWTIEYGTIDQIHSTWQPYEGNQSVDLAGYHPSTISQTISTVPGETYDLTFAMAGNPAVQEQKILGVYWDDQELTPTYTFDTTGKTYLNMGWKKITITGLKATKTTTKIAFKNVQSAAAYGVALDDVSVEARADPPPTPAPEFPSVAIPVGMLVGFLGIVLSVQKSRKE